MTLMRMRLIEARDAQWLEPRVDVGSGGQTPTRSYPLYRTVATGRYSRTKTFSGRRRPLGNPVCSSLARPTRARIESVHLAVGHGGAVRCQRWECRSREETQPSGRVPAVVILANAKRGDAGPAHAVD